MKHRELTEKIIGCAYRVYNRMGYGFLESVYEKCLLIELRKAGLSAVFQKPISVRQIIQAHEVQLVNYFVATKKAVGLIVNFGERKD
ncbi:MAG: GxxExxY protein [Thermodesulfobacteriota bacterium]|nr:GxxExxY protein [Thermodesulfobacteriota bacterium]